MTTHENTPEVVESWEKELLDHTNFCKEFPDDRCICGYSQVAQLINDNIAFASDIYDLALKGEFHDKAGLKIIPLIDYIRTLLASQKQKQIEEIVGTIEEMDDMNEITQAILGALEWRGFYDAEKYLDPTIWERIKPILITKIQAKQ